MSTINTLPDLYGQWERWAADVGESHHLPAAGRFRSPRPLSSWVTALLAVLDSAALFLALAPTSAPVVPVRLCLRAGFLCFNRIAQAMGVHIPDEPDPSTPISLTYQEFLTAVARMREVDFPIERDPAEAWPDFVGWRLNYEQAAYAVTPPSTRSPHSGPDPAVTRRPDPADPPSARTTTHLGQQRAPQPWVSPPVGAAARASRSRVGEGRALLVRRRPVSRQGKTMAGNGPAPRIAAAQ